MITKDRILATNDLATTTVEVPEWGCSVTIREMTGAQRDSWDSMLASKYDQKTKRMMSTKNLRAKMVQLSVIDESGSLMFSDKEVDALSEKSANALTRIFEAAQHLNHMTDEDVEELEKN